MPSICRNEGRSCGRSRVNSTTSPYRCLYRTISCFVLLLLLGLAGFIAGMVNYFVPPTEHPITTSPLDTRLLPFDPADCGDLEVLMVSPETTHIQVDLYLLSRKPYTSPGAIIHKKDSFYLEYPQPLNYNYYLVTGSSIQMSITMNGIEDWIYLQIFVSRNDIVKTQFCSFTSQYLSCSRTIDISQDGLYDISLHFSDTSSSHVSGIINLAVNKYIYEVDKTKTIGHCSAPCSKEINRYNEYTLVTTSNVSGTVEWSDEVEYKWICSNIRAVGLWVNLVMLLGMLLMMVSTGFIVGLSVVLCIKKRTQHDEETEPLISQSSDSPPPSLVEPPPQYTISAANPLLSLSNPPPYTESVDKPQDEGDDQK